MYFIIDVQGFKRLNNKFIAKEIAILRNGHHHHFIVKPPFNFDQLSPSLRREAQWLYQNHHGLIWDGGLTEFQKVRKYLREKIRNTIVYVKGVEKTQWLKELLQDENVEVMNIEETGCPNLKELKRLNPNEIKCLFHNKCCALQNVYLINKFLCGN